MSICIRPETEHDHAAIYHLIEQAFHSPLEATLVHALRQMGQLRYSWVAERSGVVLGHLALSPTYLNDRNTPLGLAVAPLSVAPHLQKQGIGARLIQHALDVVLTNQQQWLFLLGDVAYYQRFGFQLAAEYNLYSAFDPEGSAFMLKTQHSLLRYATRQTILYASAFDSFV